jgi:hypothetical protein
MLQHGGKEAPLRWYYDLDLLAREYSGRINWNLLLLQAQKFEWGSSLAAAFSLTIESLYLLTPLTGEREGRTSFG